MKVYAILAAFLVLICGKASAADEFDAVRCGTDIPRALIGKYSPNERVVVLEARHRDLALKDMGADIVSDDINMIDWSICGADYMLLIDRHDIIRDALAFPAHSFIKPMTGGGPCRRNGRDTVDTSVALLDNKAGYRVDHHVNHQAEMEKIQLPVLDAWKIDLKRVKFVKLDVVGLRCSIEEVSPVDSVP
jgi:hypothetical protein